MDMKLGKMLKKLKTLWQGFAPGEQGNRSKPSSLPFIAISLLLGVCMAHMQPDLIVPVWGHGELLLLLPIFCLIFYLRPADRALLACLIGYLWTLFFAHHYLQHRMTDEFEGQTLLLTGVVDGIVDTGDRSKRFNFIVEDYVSSPHLNERNMPEMLRLSWYRHQQEINPGEHWQLLVKLKVPHGFGNPNGFDYEKWLYLQGIHATGYVKQSQNNHLISQPGFSVNGLRQQILQLIALTPEQTYNGIIEALSIGRKSQITVDQWQLLIDTGTSHLMAISGLHIGLVAGLVFMVARKLVPAFMTSRASSQQYAAIAGVCIAGIYTALAGFSVPTQRAFIMLCVVMLSVLLKRPVFSLNTLAVALLAVLLINPLSALSAGFWLSFSAVLIISLIASSRVTKLSSWRQGIRVQWWIAVAMLPLTVVMFQQGSLISPVANMLMIPFMGLLIVPLILLSCLISLGSVDVAVWLFSVISDLISVGWQFLEWLTHMPFATWQKPVLPLPIALLALCGGLILILPRGFPMRIAAVVLLLPMLFYKADTPGDGEYWVTVLDVGQGLSAFIRTRNRALLYDAGARKGERFDVGRMVVVPYLRSIGAKKLDKLIISHVDNDHSGGASSVIREFSVSGVLVGGDSSRLLLPVGTQSEACNAGDKWVWDKVQFEILHPILHPRGSYSKTNNHSCVLRVSNQNSSMLIPGDIEGKVERILVNKHGQMLESDLLIMPHHGSNTSSSSALLEAVSPSLSIVSAGYKNRFGHPTKKVLARYESIGSKVLNTAYEGAIQLEFSENMDTVPVIVKRQRKDKVHYWNHRF